MLNEAKAGISIPPDEDARALAAVILRLVADREEGLANPRVAMPHNAT